MTYLDRIVDAHRRDAARDERSLEDLIGRAGEVAAPRGFRAALAAAAAATTADGSPVVAVVAEVKRRSPSKGPLAPDLDPAALATTYEAGGAACLSVLTDREFFGGSPEDLAVARDACSLPVLRKDFTVSARDVAEARLMGADAVLLIAAVLDPRELAELHSLAIRLRLDALVEVHDERELAIALDVGATLVGVNQRDLVTFEVDTDRAVRMAGRMPPEVVAVAESGIRGPSDARRLAEAGYHAVLVGESLVTAADPAAAVAALVRAAEA